MNDRPQPYSATQAGATGLQQYSRPAIATVMLVVLLTVFISAGRWQLRRAAEKEAIQDSFVTGAGMELLYEPIDDVAAADNRYRRLQLEGVFLPEQQILLDNIVHSGINGYEVLTPFVTGSTVIMVNRGWVRANPDRRVLPDISVTAENRTVTGIVNKFPAPGIRFAAEYPSDMPWPRRMLYPKQATIAEALGRPITSYQLLLTANQPDGYKRKWKALTVDSKTNYGYAFQWFSFATIALIFYVILMVRWWQEHGKAHQSVTQSITPPVNKDDS
jgi:surfeit locus 1 family protein